MAELKETLARHAGDVVAGNMAGLMGDFTPAGLAKAMAVMAGSPITAQSFDVKELAGNEAEITYIGAARRTVWSKWVEAGDKWQIDDLADRG